MATFCSPLFSSSHKKRDGDLITLETHPLNTYRLTDQQVIDKASLLRSTDAARAATFRKLLDDFVRLGSRPDLDGTFYLAGQNARRILEHIST